MTFSVVSILPLHHRTLPLFKKSHTNAFILSAIHSEILELTWVFFQNSVLNPFLSIIRKEIIIFEGLEIYLSLHWTVCLCFFFPCSALNRKEKSKELTVAINEGDNTICDERVKTITIDIHLSYNIQILQAPCY